MLDRLRELPLGTDRVGALWLGQSGFAVSGTGGLALLDPFLSSHEGRRYESALSASAAEGLDLVLCSHEHLDHFDAEAAPKIARSSPGAVFVVPSPIVDMVSEVGVPAGRVVGMQPGESLDVAGFRIDAVAARHGVTPQDAYGFGEELSGGLVRFLGYVLRSGDVRLYHAGDTIHYEGMEQTLRELRPDIALLPINGRDAEREARGIVGNLNEREAAWLAGEIDAGVLVPMHHDLFEGNLGSPGRVVEFAEAERREVAVLVPARDVPFVLSSRGPA